jgi:hypothetical protein
MRTDHLERLSSACGSLSKLAEIVLQEHERQKVVIESIFNSVQSVVAAPSKASVYAPVRSEGSRVSTGEPRATDEWESR